MTNVSTLMALAVISLVASIGFASAETIGDGTSEVHVYINNANDFPFNVTVVEGGSVVVHNESPQSVGIEHTGTIGTDKSGTFAFNVSVGAIGTQTFPVENCSSCYFAGTYYFKDSVSGETGTITIVHPDGWIPPVREEVGISETVVVVLGNNSTNTAPEPTPIEPELTGKYNVATWTGTYDMVTLQEQLAEVSAKFNQAVENLADEKNKVKYLEVEIDKIAVDYGIILTKMNILEDERTAESFLLETEKEKNEQLRLLKYELLDEIGELKTSTDQFANMTSSVTTLENKIVKLEQEKAEITIEKEKWKTLSDNWYAVAIEQLRVMVNVLGL